MKKYENFKAALKKLKDIYDYEEPYNNVVLTGLAALYEICFEQSWKAMKELLVNEGVSEAATGSPKSILKAAYKAGLIDDKSILKAAYKAGLIDDEQLWLEALATRNNVAHAYNSAIALQIVRDAREKYYDMFCRLDEVLAGRI